jgi:hypothetical protein
MDDPASIGLLLFADASAPIESPDFFWTGLKIFAVIVLVLANGFFVAAEFAFVGVRRSRIEASRPRETRALNACFRCSRISTRISPPRSSGSRSRRSVLVL